MKTRAMITAGLAITIAAAALSMVPGIAAARSCDIGKAYLLDEGARLTAEISNDRYDLETKLSLQQIKLPAGERRVFESFMRGARLDLYTSMSLIKKKHPETSPATIEGVLWSCKEDETLIIPHPAYNRLAIAELCDFTKSIVTTESSVVCAIARR